MKTSEVIAQTASDSDSEAGVATPEPVQPKSSRIPRLELPPGIPQEILGQTVVFEPGRVGQYEDRLRVKCPNAAHGICSKSRSLKLGQDKYGERATEAFLGAWLAQSFLVSAANHRKPPTHEQILEYLV